jgi:DNA repair protein RadC
MKISEIPFEERPREKAIINGIETLSNIELLAIIIRSGTRNKSAIELSFEVFNHFKNINNLMNSSLSELKKIKGLDNAKSISILASLEFAKRCTFIKKEKRQHIDNSKDIFELLKDKYRNEQQENFIIVFLDSRNDVICTHLLFKGSVSSSNIHPRDIFREAMKNNANRIIIAHNHPSGDPSPSESDLITTKSLLEISRFIAIPIVDHVILGDQTYFSFKENKLI